MANLIQISDPHFGSVFSNTRESRISASLNVHDYILCQALDRFLSRDISRLEGVSADEDLFLVMNGDLTAAGKKGQFENGNTFLFSQHALPSAEGHLQQVGLAHPIKSQSESDLYAGVPGNHDHGGGNWFFPLVAGFVPRIYGDFLDIPPYVKRFYSSDGIEICVFGVDSCSLFDDFLNLNPLADGGFSIEHQSAFVELLNEELSKPIASGCQLRTAVIICHHPFQADGSAGPLLQHSALQLARIADQFGIRMIFTGHTHRSWTEAIRFRNYLGDPCQIREVRCPTTLQGPARLDQQHRSPGLWLHQVSASGDNVVWEGTLMLFSGKSFITPVNDNAADPPERVGWYREEVPNLEQLNNDWMDTCGTD